MMFALTATPGIRFAHAEAPGTTHVYSTVQSQLQAVEAVKHSAAGPTYKMPVATVPPFAPIGELKEYVCAFHLYAHTNARQMEAHHYCSVINGGKLHQCVLYDNNTAGARLLGVEYLIPADI